MYEKLLDMNALYKAFKKCKQDVSWKYSVQKFESNLLLNLYELRQSLIDGTYKQRPFYEFDICERGKPRHIKALDFRDRVLQRALCDEVLIPALNKYLIYDNGASIEKKGVDFARVRMRTHLRRYFMAEGTNKGYVLQIDFKKYFDNINTEKAYDLIAEKIDDKRVLDLVKYLLSTFGNKGVGIGSQISQVVGICYPIKLDNYIKIVKGCKYYGRYMDDLYIIHKDKTYLRQLLEEIKQICSDYDIIINDRKTQIRKISNRFTFLKIRFRLTETGKVIMIPDRSIISREHRKLKHLIKENLPTADQYRSVKGMITGHQTPLGEMMKYHSKHMVQNLDNYYNNLLKEA